MTTATANRKKAERIANRLFTNGAGEFATRLVLFDGACRDLGGWCFVACCDQIERELNKDMKAKDSRQKVKK